MYPNMKQISVHCLNNLHMTLLIHIIPKICIMLRDRRISASCKDDTHNMFHIIFKQMHM